MTQLPDNIRAVRRAALPEVMFPLDFAIALELPVETAETYTVSGAFGPVIFVGGRAAVRRDDFLSTLKARALSRDEEGKEILRGP